MKSTEEIIDLYLNHKPKTVELVRRLMLILKLVGEHESIDPADLLRLVSEAYGHEPYESDDLLRDANLLNKIGFIEMNENLRWQRKPNTEFWPFVAS